MSERDDEIDALARDATLTPMREVTTRPDSALPRAEQFPSCPGCGTSVAERGAFCVSCAQKPQFQAPKGMIEVAAQPETAYAGGGPVLPRLAP